MACVAGFQDAESRNLLYSVLYLLYVQLNPQTNTVTFFYQSTRVSLFKTLMQYRDITGIYAVLRMVHSYFT